MSVHLEINSRRIDAVAGPSLFDYAEELGVRVPTSCHKNGKCRECLVEVTEGAEHLSAPSVEEEHLRDRFRLSCRAKIVADRGTIRCHTLHRGEMSIEEEGVGVAELKSTGDLDPAVTRDGDRVLLDGEPIARSRGPLLGLAVDLGTTTVVMRLVDLETGKLLATRSFENPQRFGGSDVMARIQYDSEHKGRLLQRTLLAYMGHAIEAFDWSTKSCDPGSIYEVVVAGNPTMRDLFFGLSVETIGQRPYRSIVEHELEAGQRQTTSLSVPARKLRLPIHPAARVHGLPLVSGHVGADAAACLLAINVAAEDRLIGLMDIGTNTELVIGNRHRLLAASCPAGPAFEGGAIACGMPALDGAIAAVEIADDGTTAHRVIGNGHPRGICGSGLIDALGAFLESGAMNEMGRFVDESDRYLLDEEHDIFVSEGDISELAQAKGANVAGLGIVLKRYGMDVADLDCFYLAGGFARHLNVDTARRIGLIPDLPDHKISQIGNASVEGATIALLSRARRRELEELVRRIEHIELETDDAFFDHFVEGCLFKPVGS